MNNLLKGLSPAAQLILFITITLTCTGMGSITAMGIAVAAFNIPVEQIPVILANPEPQYTVALMWMNNISQFFTFFVPVILFFLLFGGKNIHGLLLRKGGFLVWLSPLVIFFAGGIIDISSQLNKALIPENSWLEKAVKPSEELAERLTEMILDVNSTGQMVVAFLSIAVLPAIFEELSFRGVIQPLIAKITKNVHAAVWITAILFSIIHIQFYGFFPRVILAVLLGYVVIWTGSLWASIFAHFVNNAMAFFLFKIYGTMETPDNSVLSEWYYYAVSSTLLIALIMYFIRNGKWPWLSFEYLAITDKLSVKSEDATPR